VRHYITKTKNNTKTNKKIPQKYKRYKKIYKNEQNIYKEGGRGENVSTGSK